MGYIVFLYYLIEVLWEKIYFFDIQTGDLEIFWKNHELIICFSKVSITVKESLVITKKKKKKKKDKTFLSEMQANLFTLLF